MSVLELESAVSRAKAVELLNQSTEYLGKFSYTIVIRTKIPYKATCCASICCVFFSFPVCFPKN